MLAILLLIYDGLYLWARALKDHDHFTGQRTARDPDASIKTNRDMGASCKSPRSGFCTFGLLSSLVLIGESVSDRRG